MYGKWLALTILFVISQNSLALLNGGAANLEEFRKIEALAPSMKHKCDLEPQITNISPELRDKIGRNLLYNETGCKPTILTHWNSHENFASVGLPHVIWYAPGVAAKFDESFPRFWNFIRQRNNGRYPVPKALDHEVKPGTSPWTSKEQMKDHPIAKELNQFLQIPEVMGWQMEYSIKRGAFSAYKILAATSLDPQPPVSVAELCKRFQSLMSTDDGKLAITDYTNFKGEGIHFTEKTDNGGVRWGLKQVIEKMGATGSNELENRRKFAASARQALHDRFLSENRGTLPDSVKKMLDSLGGRIDRTYVNGGIKPSQCALWQSTAAPAQPVAPQVQTPQAPAGFSGGFIK